MPDAAERLVNLALFIASSPEPVTAEQCRAQVGGYPTGQGEDAFKRMFERDKDALRAAGIVIELDRDATVDRYRFDADASYAGIFELTAQERLVLRAAGAALLGDAGFPFREDLRAALAKLAPATGAADAGVDALGAAARAEALSADEDPERQAAVVAGLTSAIESRKRVTFAYTDLAGKAGTREVEPFGVFLRQGRWYLVARETSAGTTRVYAVPRMDDLTVAPKPKSPDFERPEGFDVRSWMLMPFQFGDRREPATVLLAGSAARRARALTAGAGALEARTDGAVLWRVAIADPAGLARWAVENGPGIEVLEPPTARAALEDGLRKAVAAHGR